MLALLCAEMTTACGGPGISVTGGGALPGDGGVSVSYASEKPKRAAFRIDDADLHSTGFGRLRFRARDGKRPVVYIYRATGFDPHDGPIWFVMHGAKRNAKRYLAAAAPVAERYRALAVAVEFSRHDYPRGNDYTLDVTTHGRVDENAYQEGRWRKPEDYLYAEIERLFDAVRSSLGGEQPGYYLFGHSAGAQFTHRLLTFMPDAHVLRAVAANAGWYTLPMRSKDAQFAVPYGLYGAPPIDLEALLAAPLTLLLGTEDTKTPATDPLLRNTPQAMAQGVSRLQRGRNYFETGKKRAEAIDASFGWRLVSAPGAGHEVTEVIASAGFLLFSGDRTLCRPASAAEGGALVIDEILADPPRGDRGDANRDGVRDPKADEFVEIINTGAASLCLSGWTLSDANGRRHLFPLGPPLQPGKAVVVFGGGVPTGPFAGADIQWASSGKGLSLSNAGDVLTLRDAGGAVVKQISWGD